MTTPPRMVVPPILFAPGEFRMPEGDPTNRYMRGHLDHLNEAKHLDRDLGPLEELPRSGLRGSPASQQA